ncbi:phospholipid methyltransferase family protein [Paraphysoderma sedebokerense]|nr:phospholipid methyltransferase family protein [Paraphysoderma sedebokerense]
MFLSSVALWAFAAIPIHVANYNATAHLEYNTKIVTQILGKNAVYYYAAYLVLSALIRDHYINGAILATADTLVLFNSDTARVLGGASFVFGALLNLWTLKALGIKGMYNGDSFGFLFDEPVTDGPYVYFSDPQYVGTSLACLGYAIYYQSKLGYVLAAWMYVVFLYSVKYIEGPHMARIYSGKDKTEKGKKKK